MVMIDRMMETVYLAIARVLQDKMECEPLVEKEIRGFDLNTVSFEGVGPVFDNDFGTMFLFKFQDMIDLELNISKWVFPIYDLDIAYCY
jgi:hypothetical protein